MGTDGTVTIVCNQKQYTWYVQCDAYPEGLGVILVDQLRELLEIMSVDKIKEQIHEKFKLPTDVPPGTVDFKESLVRAGYYHRHHFQHSLKETLALGGIFSYVEDGHEFYHYVLNFDTNQFYIREIENWTHYIRGTPPAVTGLPPSHQWLKKIKEEEARQTKKKQKLAKAERQQQKKRKVESDLESASSKEAKGDQHEPMTFTLSSEQVGKLKQWTEEQNQQLFDKRKENAKAHGYLIQGLLSPPKSLEEQLIFTFMPTMQDGQVVAVEHCETRKQLHLGCVTTQL